MGGDEFIIVSCPSFNTEDKMATFWDNVYEEFRKPFMIQGQEVYMTFSRGVASYSSETDNIGDVISKADHEMYIKKKLFHENLD